MVLFLKKTKPFTIKLLQNHTGVLYKIPCIILFKLLESVFLLIMVTGLNDVT